MIEQADFYDKLVSYVLRAAPVSVLLCLAGTVIAVAMDSLRTSPLPGYGVIAGTVLPLVEALLRGVLTPPADAEPSHRPSTGMAT